MNCWHASAMRISSVDSAVKNNEYNISPMSFYEIGEDFFENLCNLFVISRVIFSEDKKTRTKVQTEEIMKMNKIAIIATVAAMTGLATVIGYADNNKATEAQATPAAEVVQVSEAEEKTEAAEIITCKYEKKSAYDVDFTYNASENTESASVTVAGHDGVYWTYNTGEYEVAQDCRMELLNSPKGMIVLNEGGVITALDEFTGEVLWQNVDYNGGGTLSLVDDRGFIYIAGNGDASLLVLDSLGNTLIGISNFGEYFWPVDMQLCGDELTITFDSDDNASAVIDVACIGDGSFSVCMSGCEQDM